MSEKRVDLGFQSDITWDYELIDSRPLSENNAPDLEIKSNFILYASVLISDRPGTLDATDNFVLAQFRKTRHKKKNR